MKIVLICPSNMLYMPYVGNYTNILNKLDVNYEIINWDRFKIENESEFVYRDSKTGEQRSFLDYLKYSRFVLNLLEKNDYDQVIVFGIQLVFFLKRYLIRAYSNKYLIDIRDHNRVIRYFNMEKVIRESAFTVVSSPGYKEWLPKSDKYIINHNTKIDSLDEMRKSNSEFKNNRGISINYIGSIKNYKINVEFINSIRDNCFINLKFHGDGAINKDIENYLLSSNINNVLLTGRYLKEEEEKFYMDTDIVNVLIPNNTINSRTCLANRLYNAVIYGKPVIAFQGTYMSRVVEEYNLGLVISSFNDVEKAIMNYMEDLNLNNYDTQRSAFLEDVLEENRRFNVKLIEFLK